MDRVSVLFALVLAATTWVGPPASIAQGPDLTSKPPTPEELKAPPVWVGPTDVNLRALPMSDRTPLQVVVTVKVVEFQTTLGMETGLSAYLARRNKPYGEVSGTTGHIKSADITFPTSTTSTITVFLDRLGLGNNDVEMVLQALENENRLAVLSRPRSMVMIGSAIPSRIMTATKVPYEQTTVVGATTVQSTVFRDTGVSLTLTAPQVIDDDGNWATTEDTYIMLNINAEIAEEGQRVSVALDDRGGGAPMALQVPELTTRSIRTTVWVRNNQVLVLGGLYRDTKSKNLATLPWLRQMEDVGMGLVEKVVPGILGAVEKFTPQEIATAPLSSTIGRRAVNDGRRELVFFIRAEICDPSSALKREHDLTDAEEKKEKASPGGVIGEVLQGISEIPQGITEGIRRKDGVDSEIEKSMGEQK